MEHEYREGEKKTVLSVKNLSVSFTQYERLFSRTCLPVIGDLNLTVGEGEVVAVIGSSGSGKSLLAHAVLDLLPYNSNWSGEISYFGEILTRKRMKELRGHEIVLVPQSVSYLDPLMKSGTMLLRGSKKPQDRKKGVEALNRYGLGEDTMNRYPFELSGGMTRRVLIASAVMEHPRLVIADEPTPGLHVEAARRVLSHFREMAMEGAGVLLITHDLELALTCADKIVVFYAGTSLEEALASDFQKEENLRHPYTKALFRAMPRNGFHMVNGVQPFAKDVGEGCPYLPRCPHACDSCTNRIPLRSLREGKVRCDLAT